MHHHIKNIAKISWPIIVGQLGMILTGFFDNFMVAQVGHVELAAAGICNSIYFLISIFPMGITISYATIVSLLVGKGRKNVTHLMLRDSIKVTLILCIATFGILYLAIQQFDIFGQVAEVEALSRTYLMLLTWSLIPMLIFFNAKNICDGYGFTQGGMIITLAALALNVLFNWILIYGHWGAPALGLDGAGYATIIARSFMAISMIAVLIGSKRTPIDLNVLRQSFFRHRSYRFYQQIRKLGIPTGLQFFFEVAAFAFAAIMAGWISSEALAAHQLALTLAALTYMIASGIATGGNILVAQSMASKGKQYVRELTHAAHLIGMVSMTLFAAVFFIFNHELASAFSDDAEVVRLGSGMLIIAAIFQLGDGVQAISAGLLRGIEDVRIPSAITFMVYWLIAIPLGYYLSQVVEQHHWYSGPFGIWIGLALGLTLSAIVLTYRFYSLLRSK